MTISGEEFRHVLGHLVTGVTVLTSYGDDGPVGMAANSVGSVSMDPPLVLFCPAKSSSTWPVLRSAGRFCVNVMASHHEELSRRFALREADRFASLRYVERPAGPALEDAVAWIECSVRDEHDAGDHTVVIADVFDLTAFADRLPLAFFRGGYGTFDRPRTTRGADS
jgi:3-hydroxy-9,10-secoandrosta-1,3,5(10)-triene-9,17-dione monooxygenase reductase component